MYIVDTHCDSLLTVTKEQGLKNAHNLSEKYPHLQLFADFVPARGMDREYRIRQTMHRLDVYASEAQRLELPSIRDVIDLMNVTESSQSAAMFSIEGGGGLISTSKEIDILYRMGLRVMGLCWDSNELCASAWDENDYGLTDEGRRMIDVLSAYGIIVDVSHMSDRSFYDTVEHTSYPVIATHSNFRDVLNSPRNLTLDMARVIASRGGIIGLNLYPAFLSNTGKASFDDIYRQVDYCLDKLGEDVMCFGCDIDGTDGEYPEGFSENRSIHDDLVDMLLLRYDTRVVEKIAGQNAISFFKGNLY